MSKKSAVYNYFIALYITQALILLKAKKEVRSGRCPPLWVCSPVGYGFGLSPQLVVLSLLGYGVGVCPPFVALSLRSGRCLCWWCSYMGLGSAVASGACWAALVLSLFPLSVLSSWWSLAGQYCYNF